MSFYTVYRKSAVSPAFNCIKMAWVPGLGWAAGAGMARLARPRRGASEARRGGAFPEPAASSVLGIVAARRKPGREPPAAQLGSIVEMKLLPFEGLCGSARPPPPVSCAAQHSHQADTYSSK